MLTVLVIIMKHPQYQRDLFHNFIDFKKAFERVWHAGLWQVIRSFNIEELVQAIQALCKNSSSAVLLKSQLEEFFKTTEGDRQRCSLSPILFNWFMERSCRKYSMTTTHSSPSVEGPCNMRFADDINLLGGSNGGLRDLTNRASIWNGSQHRKGQDHDQQHE